MSQILTTTQLAELLQVDVVTIRKMAAAGEIPAFRVGSEYRFTEEDVQKFIEENRVARQEGIKA